MPPRRFPVVLAGFTAFLGLYATQPLLPLLARTFRASNFGVSLTITAPTLGVALAAPLVGRLADAMGRRRVIVASAIALSVATALAATASTLASLVAWRFVQGLLTPGVFAVTIAYIHEEWPLASAGRATAAYVSGTVTGGFTGRAAAGLIAAGANWHWAFIGLAALSLAASAAVAVWLPHERASGHPRRRPAVGALTSHLANRRLLASYVVGFGVLFSQVAMFTYVTFLLAAPPYGLSTALLGSIFAVYLIGAAITPFAGRIIDRFGHRAGLAVATGFGIGGATLTLLPSVAAIVLGLSLCATGVFIAQSAASSFVGTTAEHSRGLAIGLYATCYYAGGSAGAAVPALIWNATGWPGCVALVISIEMAMLAVAFRYWDLPHGRGRVAPGEPLG